MAEKKFGIGSAFAIGAIAAVAAGAVASYLKREELKILAEEVAAKLKKNDCPADAECCGCGEECEEEAVDIIIETEAAPCDCCCGIEAQEEAEEAPAEEIVEIVIEAAEEETEEKAEEVEE